MATGKSLPLSPQATNSEAIEPSRRSILIALGLSLLFICATRWPVARAQPFESDEFGFLAQAAAHWLPMHHTLFITFGRATGAYIRRCVSRFHPAGHAHERGALVSVWWMLRAIVRPATAAAAALVLGVGPVFWGYGAMAGNYTAIVLVGSFLLGVAYRGRSSPRAWHACRGGRRVGDRRPVTARISACFGWPSSA